MNPETPILQQIPVPLVLVAVLLALVAAVLLWRLVLTAAAIALVQWAIVTHAHDRTALLVALAIPALLAALTITRLLPARLTPARSAAAVRVPFGREERTR
jgi:hypothetical protein